MLKKAAKIILFSLLGLLLLVGVGMFWLQTSSGQQWLTKQVVGFLQKKIPTRTDIAKVRFKFPDWVEIGGIYVEDLQKDTLLAANRVYVGLDMWALTRGEISLDEIVLDDVSLNVRRTLPDTVFNFDFIVKAFADPNAPPDTIASAPIEMQLEALQLNRIKLRYRDMVVGTDADVWLKKSRIEFSAFNPTRNLYHLKNTNLQTAQITVRQYQPLKKKVAAEVPISSSPSADSLDLKLGFLSLKDYDIRYTNDTERQRVKLIVGEISTHFDDVFLDKIRVGIPSLQILNTDVAFQSPDFSTEIQNFNFRLEDFLFTPNRTLGKLKTLNFREKRGFVLQQFQTDFLYAQNQAALQNLFVKTNHSVLRERAVLRYTSPDQFSKDLGNVSLDLLLKNSQIGFQDVLTWLPSLRQTPPFDQNPNATLLLDGSLSGKINDLRINTFKAQTLQNTRLALNGRIVGLPDVEKMRLDLKIDDLGSSQADLGKILPKNTWPETVAMPAYLKMTGLVNGDLNHLFLNTHLESPWGKADFEVHLKNFYAAKNQAYDGKLTLQSFDAGQWLKQPSDQLGKISLMTTFSGQGIDPKTLLAQFDGRIEQADVRGYAYQNLDLAGTYENQIAQLNANISDPNIKLALRLHADLHNQYPSLIADADVQALQLKPLHLYEEDLSIAGQIKANFASTDPKNPLGMLTINNGNVRLNANEQSLENISLQLFNQNQQRVAQWISPFLRVDLKGQFEYNRLADIFIGEISRYFALPDLTYQPVDSLYNITIEAQAKHHPLLQMFVPGFTQLANTRLSMVLNNQNDTTLQARLILPKVEYDSIVVEKMDFGILGVENQASYIGYVDEILFAPTKLQRAMLNGTIANNVVDFNLALRDSMFRIQHRLAGNLAAIDSNYRLGFHPQNILLNYRAWQADPRGFVQFGKSGLLVSNVQLTQNQQRLSVNTPTQTPNAPIQVEMDSLRLGALATLLADSLQISGVMAGRVLLQNYTQEQPLFTGNLTVNELVYERVELGNLSVNANNESANIITAEASLRSRFNDIRLAGKYLVKEKNPLDFKLDMRRLHAPMIEPFSEGQLRRVRGALNGVATIKGSTDKPQIEGEIGFDSLAFNVTQLGATYRIHQSRLRFDQSSLVLRNFVVRDTLNQPLEINGKVNFNNLPKYDYDLTIAAKDFTVLNASRKDNELFYGKGVVDANLHVAGTDSKPFVDGAIKLKQGSDITIVLPDDEVGQTNTEGVVEFINRSDTVETENETPKTEPLNFASEISLNLEADDRSQLTIIVDELNGDNLKVKGNAQLNAGILPNGEPYIIGLYELSQGSYDITFEIFKRSFVIQKGSRLLFAGDPMKADVNITAVYPIMAELPANVSGSERANNAKIPFNVLLRMSGNLSSPIIEFEVEVDGSKVSAAQKNELENIAFLSSLRKQAGSQNYDPAQANRQVFSLLLLNRFWEERASESVAGGFNAEGIARQSASKLFSDQLNMLASDLIKGVKLDFDLNSTAVATQRGNVGQTDLSVGLSKGFLNDRLTVSVGSNFEIEKGARTAQSAEIIDNVSVNYSLTPDGRYAVRAYRKNQFQTVLEGFIVETGVSFAVVLDYETLREFFKK
ncbi:MAG: translocation/assembly module TamB domain-containing protein [Runella sp.]